jgi:4-hydroxybenzoyl-CoA thioesterase
MKELTQRLKIEWAHCDAAGIVFYPYFFVWFDQATERLFTANRLGYADLKRDFGVVGMPLLESGATYKNACRLGDEVDLLTWVDEWSGRTFVVKHRLTHGDGRPALEGFERRALIAPAAESAKGVRAIQIPADAIARFRD